MHAVGFYILPGFAGRSTHGSSLPTCSFTRLPVNSRSRTQRSGTAERVVIFPGGFGLDSISQVIWGPCWAML